MNPREIFERNSEFTGREEQFKLRPYEWEIYLRLDGKRSVQEIGQAAKLDLQWIAPAVARLEQLALIRVVEIGMEEFYRRFVNDQPVVKPVAAAPSPSPTDAVSSVTVAPVANEGKRVSFSLRRGDSLAIRNAVREAELSPPPTPTPVPEIPVPTLMPDVEEFHLKPLLDFVIAQSGGGTVGQLAVYRVFLKVPNELLRQAGIRSLNLVGAEFTIRDPALKRALLAAVEDVLGRPYVSNAPAPVAAGAEMASV